jgi:hypothetical protein
MRGMGGNLLRILETGRRAAASAAALVPEAWR